MLVPPYHDHPGIQLAAATWGLTAVSLALVALRLYTRARICRFLGADDYAYAATGALLLAFAACLHVAVRRGLGRDFWALGADGASDAILWSYVANSCAIAANALAKLSLGLFLLRVVQVPWHTRALWALVAVTAGTSAALVVMLWNQTTPVRASWDPLRTPGTWNIQIQPMSVGLGAWSSACDFFFAVFPWLIIWSLRMPRREKVMLAGGMSLGVIAGVCGIVRTVVLARLDVMNYTLNFVPYFAWAGAEIAVAMICLGIPTLRPLYLRARGKSFGYGHHDDTHIGELPQFTMCDQKPVEPSTGRDSASSSHVTIEAGPTKPPAAHTKGSKDSVDEILGLYDQNVGVIWVKNEVHVERGDANWPLRP